MESTWGFFELFSAALAGFYAFVPVLGLGIILLTLVARLLLLPLSIKQTKSMREMQVIQPEVKKLQTKYKGDPQKRNEEMMKLYKEHGVNPFGGCLPLVMQMPVFLGLFYVVRRPLQYMGPELLSGSALAEALREAPRQVYRFLGVLHLDETLVEVWGRNAIEAIPYVLLILVMGATTYYQQRQMTASRGASDAQAQQMQLIMRVLPLMLMVFGVNFPAGVVLYWVTTNAWTIVQQRLILARFGPMPGAAAAPKAKAAGKDADAARNGGKRAGAKNPKTGKQPRGKKATNARSGNGARKPAARTGSSKKKRKR